jgi:hypothetical protein
MQSPDQRTIGKLPEGQRERPGESHLPIGLRDDDDRVRAKRLLRLGRALVWSLAGIVVFWPTLSLSQSRETHMLCRQGNGTFRAKVANDVEVHVGAAREGGMSTRACAAHLSWKNQEVPVETNAAEIDLDAFGVDFGSGAPGAAFQIKKSGSDCCMEYRIYSLEKPPHLLRTITGGGFFNASDVDLDGRVEIWTSDAVGVEGFEGLALSEIEFAPTVAFRLARGRLIDVSAEFQSHFDQEIAGIREQISPQDLQDFKNSGGRLDETVTPASAERLHRLRSMKIRALEIVWAYLYSGREAEAWRALADMWPAADVERIRTEILKVRARGIHRQAEETSASPPPGKKKEARIFDIDKLSAAELRSGMTAPKAIQLDLDPVAGGDPPGPPNHMFLELVVDAAGKVRSADPAGSQKYPSDWIAMALAWKFIPALRDGHAVASRMQFNVWPRQ